MHLHPRWLSTCPLELMQSDRHVLGDWIIVEISYTLEKLIYDHSTDDYKVKTINICIETFLVLKVEFKT